MARGWLILPISWLSSVRLLTVILTCEGASKSNSVFRNLLTRAKGHLLGHFSSDFQIISISPGIKDNALLKRLYNRIPRVVTINPICPQRNQSSNTGSKSNSLFIAFLVTKTITLWPIFKLKSISQCPRNCFFTTKPIGVMILFCSCAWIISDVRLVRGFAVCLNALIKTRIDC